MRKRTFGFEALGKAVDALLNLNREQSLLKI